MPKVAYSDADRARIRTQLIAVGLELMSKQGIQHTTVEQVYKKVGISRTFFYSFFATKEDLKRFTCSSLKSSNMCRR